MTQYWARGRLYRKWQTCIPVILIVNVIDYKAYFFYTGQQLSDTSDLSHSDTSASGGDCSTTSSSFHSITGLDDHHHLTTYSPNINNSCSNNGDIWRRAKLRSWHSSDDDGYHSREAGRLATNPATSRGGDERVEKNEKGNEDKNLGNCSDGQETALDMSCGDKTKRRKTRQQEPVPSLRDKGSSDGKFKLNPQAGIE